jgi:hypothetical protein
MYSFDVTDSGDSRTVSNPLETLLYQAPRNLTLNNNIRVTKEKLDILRVDTQDPRSSPAQLVQRRKNKLGD